MATFPSSSSASGIWKLKRVRNALMGGNWPNANVFQTNLQQYYDAYLSAPTSTTWVDLKAFANLTFTNNPTVSSSGAASNYFVTFDGTSQYGTGLNSLNLSAFTIYTWIKTTTTADSATFWQKPTVTGLATAGDATQDFGLTIGAGYAGIWSGMGSTDATNQPNTLASKVNDGLWYEIAVTSDYTNGTKLYVNQVQIGSALTMSKNTNASQSWSLGRVYPEAVVYGNFSCAVFMLYTSALTTANLATNWNYFKGRYGR